MSLFQFNFSFILSSVFHFWLVKSTSSLTVTSADSEKPPLSPASFTSSSLGRGRDGGMERVKDGGMEKISRCIIQCIHKLSLDTKSLPFVVELHFFRNRVDFSKWKNSNQRCVILTISALREKKKLNLSLCNTAFVKPHCFHCFVLSIVLRPMFLLIFPASMFATGSYRHRSAWPPPPGVTLHFHRVQVAV